MHCLATALKFQCHCLEVCTSCKHMLVMYSGLESSGPTFQWLAFIAIVVEGHMNLVFLTIRHPHIVTLVDILRFCSLVLQLGRTSSSYEQFQLMWKHINKPFTLIICSIIAFVQIIYSNFRPPLWQCMLVLWGPQAGYVFYFCFTPACSCSVWLQLGFSSMYQPSVLCNLHQQANIQVSLLHCLCVHLPVHQTMSVSPVTYCVGLFKSMEHMFL